MNSELGETVRTESSPRSQGPRVRGSPAGQHARKGVGGGRLAPGGALTAVLLGNPLGGERAHGAAGLGVGRQRAADLGLAVVVAAVQVAGLEEGPGVQQAVAGLEEALHLVELLAAVLALEAQHCRVVAGLSQGHVLGLVAAVDGGEVGRDSGFYWGSGLLNVVHKNGKVHFQLDFHAPPC